MNNRGRRASLPAQSLGDGETNRSFKLKKKKKAKRLPCIELPEECGDREEAISEELKEFMKDIEPEDSEDEERFYRDLPFNEKVRLRNKLMYGSNSSVNSDILKHLGPASANHSRRGSRRGSHSSTKHSSNENMDDPVMDEDEYQQWLMENEKKQTKFTEMEIVALWNQFKLNFPHGTVSKPQLTELLQKVFPKCTTPEVITNNIFRTFDTNGRGKIEFRELLMTFAMCMQATPEEKLHWLFRLYDIDQNHSIDEDEMTEVFERLYKVALGAENVAGPPKPPTPPPPPPEVKKYKNKGKRNSVAVEDLGVKKLSSKMNKSDRKYTGLKKRPTKEQRKAAQEAALLKQQEEEAALAAAAAAEQEKLNNIEEDEEEKFDPVARAEEIFRDLDVNGDGSVDEDEFVTGCLSDDNFLFMLENFSCEFLWGDGFVENE